MYVCVCVPGCSMNSTRPEGQPDGHGEGDGEGNEGDVWSEIVTGPLRRSKRQVSLPTNLHVLF